jgi:DNA mismatch repair protein MutS
MALTKEYFELTKKYIDEYGEKTIILMQNGAFFEVYGLKNNESQLNDFSKICDLNIAEKNMIIDNDVVVNAGFKTYLINKYTKKLQDNGYTIVVYEEVGEDPIKKTKIRNQTGIFSPGTFFSTDPAKITNNICCLWIELQKRALKYYIYVGVGQIDVCTGKTCINEFNDEYIKNPTTFDDLERFISINNPSETIIVSNLQKSDIDDIVSYISLKSKLVHYINLLDENINKNTIRAKNCEKQTYQTELLSKYYKIKDINSFMGVFYDNVYATQAYCYLLDFVYQHNPHLINKISEPILENTSKRLILANHSLKQLNIIDDDNYKGNYSSVLKMLNICITSMGKRKFADMFLNPVSDEIYLQNEYDIIEKLLTSPDDYYLVKNLLVQINDMNKIMRQIISQKVSPKLMYQLYISMKTTETLYNFVSENENLVNYFKIKIENYDNLMLKLNAITNYLDQVLIIDDCKDIENIIKIDTSFIKNGVDEELDNNIKTLMDSQDQIMACRGYFCVLLAEYENNAKKNKKTKAKPKKKTNKDNEEEEEEDDKTTKDYITIHETEKKNFSLIATDKRCKLLDDIIKQNNSKKVKIKYYSRFAKSETVFDLDLCLQYERQSQSRKTIFSEQINEICKNMGQIKVILIDTVLKVYQNIVKHMQIFYEDIENISNFITNIDLVYSKTYLAHKYNYCKPEIVSNYDKSFVSVKDLRHCLIEKIQNSELYVANDIDIGNNNMDGILLYGTNAVGKTSFIKALGVSVIMAQSGLYVPATSYKYKPYKYIFTRILGNDNIFKGLSTFAVEMSELRTILRLANNHSLVLGDELCSGTESISATSIFVAGIQKLASIGCTFIFATHLHEIVNYEEITSLKNVCMKHMSVMYDKENDCLVYSRKLQNGSGNKMYGLEVCKGLNLPQEFLDNAHNIRMKYYPETGSILDQKQSRYNAKHITGGLCELCKINTAVDVHHLMFQNEADQKGTIKKKGLIFNKNNTANIINLCKKCHDENHKSNIKFKKTKTTNGTILEKVVI